MQTIGYQLTRISDGAVIQQWGGSFEGMCGMPSVLYLPDDAGHVHCPELGTEYNGFRLEEWKAEPDLPALRASAKRKVSASAEAARSRYMTPGSLKAVSYIKVAEEATTFMAMKGVGNYPLLQARVNSGRYPDLQSAVKGILATEDAATNAAAAIDELEDRAKLAIDAANTAEQISAALIVQWP